MKKNYAISCLLGFLVVGCSPATEATPETEKIMDTSYNEVYVIEDTKRKVTCYVYEGYKAGGIFCLTEKQLKGE